MMGQSIQRRDGHLKVTGSARYAYEHNIPRVTYGFILGATIAKGAIVDIDDKQARSQPGVLEIMTFRNTPRQAERSPQSPGRPFVRPWPVLQGRRVDLFGQPVAFVIAETFEQARSAAMMIKISYRSDAATFRIEDARDRAYAPSSAYGGMSTDSAMGDVEEAMNGGSVTLDQAYKTSHQFALPLEPQACIASWEGNHVTVSASVQIVSAARSCLANTLNIPESSIYIASPFVGGGFGSKLRIHEETVLAVLGSQVIGRPVKVAQTRRQSFYLSGHRGEMLHRVRLAADASGRLMAIGHDVEIQSSPIEHYVEQVATVTRALYAAPNRLTRHRVIDLNVGFTEAVRGPGEVPGLLVVESAMDELAHKIGIDPIELRIRNEPDIDPERRVPFGQRRLVECMKKGAEIFNWDSRSQTPKSRRENNQLIGMGMAAGIRTHFQGATRVVVQITSAGEVVVKSDMTDIGTGTYTILAQVAAEVLGVDMTKVQVELARSDLPVSAGSGGSYGASNSATALRRACVKLQEMVVRRSGGPVHDDLVDTAIRFFPTGLEADGVVPAMNADPRFSQFSLNTYCATFAEVRVDAVSGEVRVNRMLGVFDAGKIINPLTARSQLVGGMLWGLASALHEGAHIDPIHGHVVNGDLAEYLVPVHADIPEIEAIVLPGEDINVNELGIKGVGELGGCGTGAAIANAVFNATGVRIRQFPITLDKILHEMS